jgi:hypothetical protein
MFWVSVVALALVVGLGAVIWTTNLLGAFDARKAEVAAVPHEARAALTELHITHPPPPLQKYLGDRPWNVPAILLPKISERPFGG